MSLNIYNLTQHETALKWSIARGKREYIQFFLVRKTSVAQTKAYQAEEKQSRNNHYPTKH